jgi:beta-glucanase (GH16 family)
MAPLHSRLLVPSLIWAIWLCGGVAKVQAAEVVTPPEPAAKVVFFDDFTGEALDRTQWNVIVTGQWVNNEQQAYIDSPDVIRIVHGAAAEGAVDGALELRAVSRPGFVTANNRKFEFVSGRIDTRGKFESAYGTWAARMKLPAGAGLWPAFWALGTGRWPDTGEVDIMEYVGGVDWISAALHGPGYSGNTPLVKRTTLPADRGPTDWHIYSVDWSPTEFLFKVDGVTFYQVPRATIEQHGRYVYDNPKFVILNLALGGNYPMSVNGEKGPPHPGLPAATVQRIKDGEARVLVDWVRVTQAPGQMPAAK